MHKDKPVPGWTAKETYIGRNAGCPESYCVTDCPLYIAPSEERLAEQMRQDAEEHRKEQDRRRSRLFF